MKLLRQLGNGETNKQTYRLTELFLKSLSRLKMLISNKLYFINLSNFTSAKRKFLQSQIELLRTFYQSKMLEFKSSIGHDGVPIDTVLLLMLLLLMKDFNI